jgi:uncharacterized protein YlxW (UPF0749 family)
MAPDRSDGSSPARGRRRIGWSLAVPVIAAAGALMVVASAFSADGTDLRPTGTSLQALVDSRAEEVASLRADIRDVEGSLQQLSAAVSGPELRNVRRHVARLGGAAGLTPVTGAGVRVTLDDSPSDTDPGDIDPNLLVVHQGDIQAFVNALWQGGAVGITLQGQRLISTSGVKCVGNTVVLHGVPYSPPYRIEAVGEPGALTAALDSSRAVSYYRQYVDAYDLGLLVEEADHLQLPAFSGRPALVYAEPL